MEPYIQISKINDFLYCPLSIYLHSIYENFDTKMYHQSPQVIGRIKHEPIEEGTYSTSRRYVCGLEIWSEKYNLVGKIDIYDRERRALIERKTRVKNIYDGYRFQLFAQYFCMEEMGYLVDRLFIHSLEDNRRYAVDLPVGKEKKRFEKVIENMKNFKVENFINHTCPKCAGSIYGGLAW